MTRLVLALIRIIALGLSYILSTFAAAAFVSFALFLGGDSHWVQQDPTVALGTVGFALAAWFEIGQVMFAPFVFYCLVAEPARLSGFTVNLLAGGGLALIYMVMTGQYYDLPYTQQETWLAALAAGFTGGAAHWLLAGHRAGNWLGPKRQHQQPDSTRRLSPED